MTYLEAETSSYYKYEACPVAFSGFVWFEVKSTHNTGYRFCVLTLGTCAQFFMLVTFGLSFYYVQRRKRRQQQMQQWRISSY